MPSHSPLHRAFPEQPIIKLNPHIRTDCSLFLFASTLIVLCETNVKHLSYRNPWFFPCTLNLNSFQCGEDFENGKNFWPICVLISGVPLE